MAKEKTEQRIKKALGRDDKGGKGKTHVHGMHIRRAASGGFIARHEMAGEDGAPADMGGAQSPEHIIPDGDALHAHLDEHMGDQPSAGEAPAAAAPPPQAGPDAQQA